MKSVKAQLLVTLVAVAVAAAFFIHRGPPPRMGILEGADRGNVGAVQRNIRWGVDVNARHYRGLTPLHSAANKDIAALLIAKGGDVNIKDDYDWTPLHSAADKDVAEVLIAKGAEVNAKDNDGRTPLHSAADKDVTALLIAHGADVNAKSNNRLTPLQIAVARGKVEVADLLRRHGASE